MREVDGVKIAFVQPESYFEGLHAPSLFSTWRGTGADMVILLAPGKNESDLSDEDIRCLVESILSAAEEITDD